jgi:hypothetical protein
LLVADGNAELSNKMVSYTMNQKVFLLSRPFTLLAIVLLWRDDIIQKQSEETGSVCGKPAKGRNVAHLFAREAITRSPRKVCDV